MEWEETPLPGQDTFLLTLLVMYFTKQMKMASPTKMSETWMKLGLPHVLS